MCCCFPTEAASVDFFTDRFGMLPLDEPAVLLSEFLDRFQSLCHLDLQLPSLRPEDLKGMVSFSGPGSRAATCHFVACMFV